MWGIKLMVTVFFGIVDSMVEWLKHHPCHPHGLGSKPAHTILLCPWERHLMSLFLAGQSWLAILSFSHIFVKPKKQK